MSIVQRLQSLRSRLGWSRIELAKYFGCTTPELRSWETQEKIPLPMLLKITRLQEIADFQSDHLRCLSNADLALNSGLVAQVRLR